MEKKSARKTVTRVIAVLLSFTMVFSSMSAHLVSADTVSDISGIKEEELSNALLEDDGQYPEGGFEFYASQLEGNEGDQLELTVVRRGERSKAASVDFKAVSVTAAYGEDYTLSVKGNLLTQKELSSSIGAETLSDLFQKAQTSALLTGEPSEEAAETAEDIQVVQNDAENDAVNDTQNDTAAKIKAESPLQIARDTYLQSESSSLNWTQIDEANQEEAKQITAQGEQALEEFAQNVEGVEYTLEFDKDEYKKTIVIDIIDDDVSETDEQVMFLLSNASKGELAGNTTAYLNIKDNDEGGQVIFAMDTDAISVDRAAGVAKIKIRRVSGVEKLASVIVGTGAVSAQPDIDYVSTKEEMIFGQGITEQELEIKLLENPEAAGDVTFKVALDADNSFVQEGKAETLVIIENKAEEAGPAQLVTREAVTEGNAQRKTGNAASTVTDKPSNSNDDEGEIEAYAATSKTVTYNVNAFASIKSTSSTSSSMIDVLKNVDLSLAESVDVTWTSEGYNAFFLFAYYHTGILYINGITAAQTYNYWGYFQNTEKITLTDAMKAENANLTLQVSGRTPNGKVTVSKVVVRYPGYQITVSNTPYTEGSYSNQYTEKIYCAEGTKADANGHRYKEGNTNTLATLKLMSAVSTTPSDSIVVHSVKDNLSFIHSYSTNKNSNGVGVDASYSGNVYLAGYQLSKPGSSSWSELIYPDNFIFNKNFVKTYKSYMYTGNEFKVRPVYRPYAANVMFQNLDTAKGSYDNNYANNEIFRCTQLDTITVKGLAKTGYSVDGFSIGAYADSSIHTASSTKNQLAIGGESYYSQSVSTIKSKTNQYAPSNYTKVAVKNAVTGGAVKNVITFTPDKEYTYLNMAYSTPQIDVKIDPLNNNKDKGAVIYSDDKGAQEGNYQTPLKITGVTLNEEYTFTAVTDDNYKAYWKNFTGDANGDGRIDVNEQKEVDKYNFVRTASNGNVYTFRPILPNSLLYYGFKPKEENRYAGYVDGVVGLKTKPIFSTKETIVPINGAAISVSGMTTTTKTDDNFGGLDAAGGDGYFSLSDREFVAGDNVTVNITYETLGLSAAQAVNAAGIYILDSYDTIRVDDASAYLVSGNTAEVIKPAGITNGDKTYRIRLVTSSTNDTVAASKAVFRFYRKDGTKMDEEKTVTSANGIFVLDFNPASLKIPVGAVMTVQFYDQKNRGYFEHRMDFSFAQSLGVLSFLSSFNFGGAEKAVEIIGVINSKFNFGWDGDLDKESKYVTNSEDGMTKTISLGFDFDYAGEVEKELGTQNPKKQAVKDAAGSAGTSGAQRSAQSKAADNAIDSNDKGNKTSTKLGASAGVSCSFALGITMAKSEDPEHKGEWYFQEMLLCVKASGGIDVEISYITPIGIPITVSVSTGVSGAATFVVEQNYDKKEYYVSNVLDKNSSKIDIFSFNRKNSDSAFVSDGIFTIAPYFHLSAGVGFKKLLNLELAGKADFNMNFYVDTNQQNNGAVNLSSELTLTILGFDKTFKIASKNFNLFGNASNAGNTDSMNRLTDQDYRYESLSGMETVNRDYLKSSQKWNGSPAMTAQSVADTSGIKETVLKNGIYPYPNIELSALGDGKYLGLFIDDDPSRSDYNRMALYYTIFNGSEWSAPLLVENDGTLDEAPNVFDLGDRLYIAWSTANQVFTEEPGVIDVLKTMDIHGCFFDKGTLQFGDIQKVTQTAPFTYTQDGIEVRDEAADVEPKISYDEKTNRMLLFYTKSEYSSSSGDEDGVISDLINPYSVIAYRVYDFETGAWQDSYSEAELVNLGADYQQAWYGQRFLELAPLAKVNESLDNQGYWIADSVPQIEPYQNVTYLDAGGNEVEQEPIVIESDSITYNGLGLFTYVLDYDGNKETEQDRDIFVQIYNFDKNEFTHPIMITSDEKAESNIRLAHGGGRTFLSYLSDGTLQLFDIANAVKNRMIKDTVDGKEFYYVDRTLPDENHAADQYPLLMTIAGKDAVFSEGSEKALDLSLSDEENANAPTEQTEALADDTTITGFEVSASPDNIYMFWTQRRSVVKEGIDETSEEAALAENRQMETQIYGIRYDGAVGDFGSSVKVTDEAGMNYSSLNFVVDEGAGGTVKALAAKAGSTTLETVDGDGDAVVYPVEDIEHRALVCLDFTPVSTLKVTDISIVELTAGKDSAVNIELMNDGLENLSGLTFVAKAKDGSEIHRERLGVSEVIAKDDGTDAVEIPGYILGGSLLHIGFPVTLGEDATGTEFTYCITNKDNQVLAEGEYAEEIPAEIDINSFEAVLTDRNTVKFSVELANNGRRKTGEQNISIKKGAGSLVDMKIASLQPSECVFLEKEYSFSSYSQMFRTYQTENSALQALTKFTASTGCGEDAVAEIRLLATKEQRLVMDSITSIAVMDNATLSSNMTLEKGADGQLQTAIETIPYTEDSRYEGMDDADYNTGNTSGLRVLYKVDNSDVIKLYDSGYIEALKAGTATVTAYVTPNNNRINYNEQDGSIVEDNFLTLPEEAIKKQTITITVKGKNEGGGGVIDIEPDRPDEITKVTLDKSKLSLPVKGSTTLKATLTPANAADTSVTWESSKPSVATVSNGKVTAKKVGTTVITATSANGKKATCTVTVTSVKFKESSVSIGVKEKLEIKPVLSDKTTDKLTKVSYTTSNKKVAAVTKLKDGSVRITGKKTGTATITVKTTSGAKAAIKVKVLKAPSKITVKKETITVKKGKTATIKYSLPKGTASSKITFTSKNKKIAKVSSTGKITGVKKGKTTITVSTYNNKKVKITVIVK